MEMRNMTFDNVTNDEIIELNWNENITENNHNKWNAESTKCLTLRSAVQVMMKNFILKLGLLSLFTPTALLAHKKHCV